MTTEPKTKIQDAQDCITAAKHLLCLMEIASEELEMGNVLDGVEISRQSGAIWGAAVTAGEKLASAMNLLDAAELEAKTVVSTTA